MPELPEVHTIVNDLKQAGLEGRTIQNIFVYWPKTVATPDLASFCKEIIGQKIVKIERRGKYLIFHLSSSQILCIHLRMTGHLLLADQSAPEGTHAHVRLCLDLDKEQRLYYQDTRKFGRWYLTSHLQEIIGHIGPEPLDACLSTEKLWHMLQASSRALKPLLLDQTFLSGLGNIYVDEALWDAQLHPLQIAKQLSLLQTEQLLSSMRKVLQRGIDSQGTTLGTGKTNYYRLDGKQGNHQTLLQVFRQTGKPCLRCQTSIQKIVVAQRGTHFCPSCQYLT